jgi:hypothetical protein
VSRTRSRITRSRDAVRLRAGGICEVCGIETNRHGRQTDLDFPTMHHRWPRREGGLDHVSNLLFLCRNCHANVVHADEYVARLLGRMASEYAYRHMPVLTHVGWVLLLDDGSYGKLPWWVAEELTKEHAQLDD